MPEDKKQIFDANLELMSSFHPINKELILKSFVDEEIPSEEFTFQDEKHLDIYEGIFLYGIQKGEWVATFLSWLNAHASRRLIVCDNDPKKFASFFSLSSAKAIIEHPRLHLILTPDGINETHNFFLKQIITSMIMNLNLRNALFIEHFERKDLSGMREKNFNDAIEKGLSDYYANDVYLKGQNHKTIVNHFENLSMIQDSVYISDLKDAFKGQPIVLCAAGFSMPKLYDKLKSIHHHTLIAAAGTGASLLSKNGIDCHFNAILDVSPSKKHTSYYQNHHGVLFYLLRSGNQGVCQHQGIKVLCDTLVRSELSKMILENKVQPDLPSNMYWTVTDLLLEQLVHLGFSPIYMCGIDHIMDKEKYYAEDVIKTDKNTCSEKMYIHAQNIKNQEVLTKFDWHQGTKKINDLCAKCPDTEFIYVSDEGLPIPNAKQISTDEFNQIEFENTGVCEEKYIPKFINAPKTTISNQQLVDFIDKMLESFTNCRKIFERIDIELGKHFFAWQVTPIDALNPYTGVFFHLHKLLSEEPAYSEYLSPSWELFKTQIHLDAGFFGESTKAKLTLFALKTRELDYLKHHNMLFHNLFVLQRKQIEERAKLFNFDLQEASDTRFDPVGLPG